jgi:uncharacterized phosphosugar-binding protein
MSASAYIDEIKKLIERIEQTQVDSIHKVAELVSEAIIKEKLIYVFGAGHSNILAIECFDRAGGLANMQPMLDAGLDFYSGSRRQSYFERLPGYINGMVEEYGIQPGDLVIIISNSGRNPAPVQMALEVKKRGAVVVALLSKDHSERVSSNDPSGKKLIEIADIVLDNGCPAGDALVELPGLPPRVGPGSTVAGAIILNAIVTQAAKNIREKGLTPPVGYSGNLPEAKKYNEDYLALQKILLQRMRHI